MWNGKGFPPVGTVCECNCFGEWRNGEVMQVTETMCRVRLSKNSPDFVFSNPNDMRPKTEWNGEGFPPVGTVCEFKYFGDWKQGTVTTSDDKACGVSDGIFGILTVSVSDLRPLKTEWNGEGFPPSGIECEIKYRNKWVPCHVIGMDDLGNCVARHDMEYLATQLTEHFRPLRTERQIAQDAMRGIAMANPRASMVKLFGLIHDAGYTK